jgi:PAS domain S-box-containing protein
MGDTRHPVDFLTDEDGKSLMLHRRSDDDLLFRSGESVFAIDRSLRIVAWSAGAEKLLGFAASEVLGKSCCQLIACGPGPDKPLCHRYFAGVLDGSIQEPIPPFDYAVRTKDRGEIQVNVATVLISSEQVERRILMHVLRDLTHERETADLLHRVASHAAKLSSKRSISQRELGADAHLAASPSAAATIPPIPPGPIPAVTAREEEVLRLLAEGASTEIIASRLFISVRTARNHIQNVLAKLSVHSRLEAVALARSRGLI